MSEVLAKTCSKCGGLKPLSEFYAHARSPDGRRPECKRCHNRGRAQWARRRYVPRTGRRYVTRSDREGLATIIND
ncbi:MAG TPA: hypothetical protein VIP46_20805 [Pyrinomonadaceae bacterium]